MTNKLWILKPVEDLPEDDNPWEPWYDKVFSMIISAESEEEARMIAHEEAGCENIGEFLGKKTSNTQTPWLDSKYSTIKELKPDECVGLIIKNERNA